MLRRVSVNGERCTSQWRDLCRTVWTLRTELGCERIATTFEHDQAAVVFALEDWRDARADLLSFDERIHRTEDQGDFDLMLTCSNWAEGAGAALELLTRYQRLLPLSPAASRMPQLGRVLEAHRDLFDLRKPLVRADYDHAVDTWRWLLRLSPRASVALQLAALFHDIERLESEADERREQHASDYLAFKVHHAARGAQLAARTLYQLGFDDQVIERAIALIYAHEQPGQDAELLLLNDADALSFFSLNTWGYLRYYGAAQTERKVAYTLGRMSHRALALLASTRQPPLVAALLSATREREMPREVLRV